LYSLAGFFKDPVNSDYAVANVGVLEFTYDPENKVNAPYNNQCPFFMVAHTPQTKTLKFTMNLAAAQSKQALYYVMEKTDDLLHFSVRTAQHKAERVLDDLSLHLLNNLQFDLKFRVEYEGFLTHPNFIKNNAAQRAYLITQFSNNLVTLWRQHLFPMFQTRAYNNNTVKAHIKQVTATLDPVNEYFHQISKSNSQPFYKVDFNLPKEQLEFTVALSQAKETLNYMRPLVETVLDVATAQ
jgi:hypothetical protein